MNFLKKIFGKQNEPITSYEEFWKWFQKNEKDFFEVVQNGNKRKEIEKAFFNKLSPKLDELSEGFFFLTGMYDDNTVELIITPEGIVKNIVFVEELISSAPTIAGWKFTALKPANDVKNASIEMNGYDFNQQNLSFYPNVVADCPDEIDITIVYEDFEEQNKETISNGAYIFLDNYIGELNFVTSIDNIKVTGKQAVQPDLIPIEKLKDYLIWRKKEFVEKYEGLLLHTETSNHSLFEAELQNGNKLVATINTDVLNWENKASHPWILTIEINYDGKYHNGMPDENTYQLLETIEQEILLELKNADGFINIGRQTANSVREIFFACKDFRKPSKVLRKVQNYYTKKIPITYEIYIDKYWQSFNRFTA